MEVFLVLITAGIGVIEGVLEMASESLGGFKRLYEVLSLSAHCRLCY